MIALSALLDELGAGVVVTDPEILASYRHDWARTRPPARRWRWSGQPLPSRFRRCCAGPALTSSQWCPAARAPDSPVGRRPSTAGSCSTEKMREITVDPVTRTAVAQPGLLNVEVKKAVAAQGLWYPPDPSSYEICSIGGNIATNAGGLCCVKYGVTTDYVLGLQVVLADGTAVRLGGPRLKDVAGLSLTKLFVGSEGTLGVVTEVTLRLLPPQPTTATVVATFDSVEAATSSVVTITRKIRPSMLEFMDGVAINAVEDKLRMGLDRNAAAMMVAASDDRGPAGAQDAEFMAQVFTDAGATECFSTDDPVEERPSSQPAGSPSQRSRPRAHCYSRMSAYRCPNWPTW